MYYPRIVGHRGAGALAPENTLASLRLAARLGCRGVEFDVMLTADRVPVLIHDETLERTTDGHGEVAMTSAAEFARLDAGGKFHRAFAVEPAPTFQAALALCAALGLWANVEIKPAQGHDEITGSIVARTAAAIAARTQVKLLLSSFSPQALNAAAASAPQLARALLVEAIPHDWRDRLAATHASALHFAAREFAGSRPIIEEMQHAGIPLACYTVNRRDQAETLFAAGIRAVFSDRPDLWSREELGDGDGRLTQYGSQHP
ncbi:MAG TPA: glycerophosphodiester phosphodiesterase [Rhodocyclaceae bacterium]|nr:glycerophosphodiester phosphodiesterase [Rhodocyclaceae bacterium]